MTSLKDGLVKVCDLRFLSKRSARLFDLCQSRDAHQSGHKIFSDARRYLDERMEQLDSYQKERCLLENFVSACRLFTSSEDLSQLACNIRSDVSNMEIRSLAPQDSSQSVVVSCFSVPSSYHQYVELTWKARNSCIFKMLWNEMGCQVARSRRDRQPPLTLAEIVEMICKPIADQWQSICNEVVNGTIPLERVSILFGSPETETVNLDQELNCMGDFCGRQENAKWKQQRKKQIEQYSKLESTVEAGQTLKKVMSALYMPQGFKEIDYICTQVSWFAYLLKLL